MMSCRVISDIILYGGPASGKSTQAKLLVKKLKASHMNMGQLLRNALIKKITGFKKIKKYMQAGQLVPEIISSKLVKSFINKASLNKRIIFDGYPRRMRQVKIIEPILKRLNREVVMVFIDLPIKVARKRIKKRAQIENRVDDTKLKVINERIEVFKNQAKDILEHYKNRQALIKINGDQDIQSIHKDIIKAIKAL